MAALRLRTSSPTKEPWQPYMSPVSPTADSPNQAASPSTSLSDRCRQLAFRLGGSAVQDDEHFCEQPTSPTESVHASPGKRRQSSANESSPPRGLSNYNLASSGAGGLAPPAPLSPRSHPPTSPDTTHVLNEILEEGESGGEPTPRAENGPRGVYAPTQPSLGFAALGPGDPIAERGQRGSATSALGIDYGSGLAPPASFSSMMPDLPTEEADTDDDAGKRVRNCSVSRFVTDCEALAEAVIEERVAEIQNLLQEGATWQAVDIWLSEGDLLVSLSLQTLS